MRIGTALGSWPAAAVAGLVIELGAAGDKTLSARLGPVMGDLNLVVAFPVERGYVDEQGHAVTIAGAAS